MAEITRFTASFDQASGCTACLADIEEGDEIGYVDDEICCGSCCDEAKAEEQDEIDNSGWFK